jgi:hypothetical protein
LADLDRMLPLCDRVVIAATVAVAFLSVFAGSHTVTSGQQQTILADRD